MIFSWIPDFKETFEKQAHEKYLKSTLKMILAPACSKYDPHKMLFLYCCLGGLRALGVSFDKDSIEGIRLFIENSEMETNDMISYAPSPFLKYPLEPRHGDIITTYLAISCVTMISENSLPESKRDKIGQCLHAVFQARESSINLREHYALCATYKLLKLDIPSHIAESICNKVLDHQTYDGAFALEPESESHAAATLCAIACLKMLNQLSKISPEKVKRWALMRQVEYGFSVR